MRSYQMPTIGFDGSSSCSSPLAPWPVQSLRDEAFLHALRQDVSQPLDLGLPLAGDGDRGIALAPDLLWPVAEVPDLSGQVAIEIAEESRQVVGVPRRDDEVVVVGEEGEGVEDHLVLAHRPAEHALDDALHLGRGLEEEAALEGALGDLDGMALGGRGVGVLACQTRTESGACVLRNVWVELNFVGT